MMLLGSWFRQRKEERDTIIGKPKKGEKNRGEEEVHGKETRVEGQTDSCQRQEPENK